MAKRAKNTAPATTETLLQQSADDITNGRVHDMKDVLAEIEGVPFVDDAPQVTHFDPPPAETSITGELDYLRRKLFAAEELIDAHQELLTCYVRRMPRNKSIDVLTAARKRFEEVAQ